MKTVVGLDYGTQSARAVLVDAQTGETLRSHSVKYPHGVMAGDLADINDYEQALAALLAAVVTHEYRDTLQGICVDATSLTLVPIDKQGAALALLPAFADRPQAQIKLWKRHTAHAYAHEALTLAQQMHEPFLARTGGTISEEWMLPKLLEMHDEDPEAFAHMDAALDLCEYLTYRLTGKLVRSMGSMSYKCLYAQDLGLPSEGYLNALRPDFARAYAHLMRGDVICPGDPAGTLQGCWRERLGLTQPVTVAAGALDGHTSLVALGAMQPGDAALVVGTSNVLTIQSEQLHPIAGLCGVAQDALVKGRVGVDSGQSCTGDLLEWYMRTALPTDVQRAAAQAGLSAHQWLAQQITEPWNNALTLVDWWNGSRNAPCDLALSGAAAGLTLNTQPQDIYLAMLQGIVCGTKEIINACQAQAMPVRRVFATGGIAEKSPLLMQEYANMLELPVYVAQVQEGPALGAAIFAAVAAGIYPTAQEACAHMGVRSFTAYAPDAAHQAAYRKLWQRNHALRQCIRTWKKQDCEG